MNLEYLIKSFLVGGIWAGSLYTCLAFIFLIVPLPAFYNIYTWIRNYARKQLYKNPQKGIRIYDLNTGIMRFLAMLVWVAVLAGFVLSLPSVLDRYLPNLKTDPNHWYYLLIAGGLPFLLFGVACLKALRRSEHYTNRNEALDKEIQKMEADKRSLLEKMKG
jgi:hypothetical protein